MGLIEIWFSDGMKSFVQATHQRILKKKVRFPILEYATKTLFSRIPEKFHFSICDELIDLDEIGSYVISGMVLQLHLEDNFRKSIRKAGEYIIRGDKWHVCDIIGERAFGHSLLTRPQKTIPILLKNSLHPNEWMIRSNGVAVHYAVKKGLNKNAVEPLFHLLLKHADAKGFHVKKGIGWAVKTIAKFHPEIIYTNLPGWKESENLGHWFKTKIRIGLSRQKEFKEYQPMKIAPRDPDGKGNKS